MWVEDLKCMHGFWDVKEIISRWILYLILCRLKWVMLHSCQPNTTRLLTFRLKCMHFFWSVKNLFLDKCYIFVKLYNFECRLKTWSVCITFMIKKKKFKWMLYLILYRLKWVVLHSYQPNTTCLLRVSSGLG